MPRGGVYDLAAQDTRDAEETLSRARRRLLREASTHTPTSPRQSSRTTHTPTSPRQSSSVEQQARQFRSLDERLDAKTQHRLARSLRCCLPNRDEGSVPVDEPDGDEQDLQRQLGALRRGTPRGRAHNSWLCCLPPPPEPARSRPSGGGGRQHAWRVGGSLACLRSSSSSSAEKGLQPERIT